MHTFAVSKQVTNALKELSLKEGVTLFMMMVAAFQTLLYRYTGQQDILLGTTVSDRRRPEVQQLIGFFLNTLVLRTDVSQNPSFRMFLQQVRAMTLEAQMHQDVPFESLVKPLQPERNPGQNPLFQVMIALEPPLSTLPSGWTLTQMDIKADAAKFDLYLELDDRPEGLVGRFEYNTDLFDKERIVRMTEHWQTLLEGIVATPEKRVSELPILTPAEQLQVVVEWNATQTPYPNQYVHSLFEVQVARAPDAVALLSKSSK